MRGIASFSTHFLSFVLSLGYSVALPTSGVFQSKRNHNTGIRYVQNSGVCETTPGVGQVSGYIDIGTNMSMVSFSFLSRFEKGE